MANTSSTHTDTRAADALATVVVRAEDTCAWLCVCVCDCECAGVRVCVRGSSLNGYPEANGLGYISTWAVRVFRQQHVYRYSFAYLLNTRIVLGEVSSRYDFSRRCFDFSSNRNSVFENTAEERSTTSTQRTKLETWHTILGRL